MYAKLQLEFPPLSKYREQQASIRTLGSVCHRWRSICLELLFEHVWIAPPLEPNTLAFRQIFDTDTLSKHSRNSPGWWTRQLYLDIFFLEPPERKALINHFQTSNPFPNVIHLFITNCGRSGNEENGERILDVYAKHLTSLMLNGSKDIFRDMISRAPGALSQLQELGLEFSGFSHEPPPSQDKRDTLVLPSTHTLHLRHPKQNDYIALLDWSFPSLQALAISTAHSLPDTFGPFIHLHGSKLTSLSIPYWPSESSIQNDLFEACRALERLEVLSAEWEEEDDVRQPTPVTLAYFSIMGEHGLQEWIFKPFWVDCDFDTPFEDFTADPDLFPSLQRIKLLSPGVDKIFSLPLTRVQSLRDWSRALKVRGVSLVNDEDGISISLSTICINGGSDQHSSSLFRIVLTFWVENHSTTRVTVTRFNSMYDRKSSLWQGYQRSSYALSFASSLYCGPRVQTPCMLYLASMLVRQGPHHVRATQERD
jgi:hypothetical protein